MPWVSSRHSNRQPLSSQHHREAQILGNAWDRLAEIRTMAVSPRLTRRGIGAEIVKRLLEEGRKIGVTKFFTLTYKPGFFQTLGFHTVTKETLPPKVWKDCIDCPKFPNCDEIALIREEEGEAPALPKGF